MAHIFFILQYLQVYTQTSYKIIIIIKISSLQLIPVATKVSKSIGGLFFFFINIIIKHCFMYE